MIFSYGLILPNFDSAVYNTHMKLTVKIFLVFLCCFPFVTSVSAAKPRASKKVSTGGTTNASYSTAKLSRGTNSVIVTFQNLASVKKVSYELSYTANGIAQGVIGTVQTTGLASDSRDLYFGTCSKGVCTPHYNITGATLTITSQLTNGGTNIKRYKIKI
jgi:hypothetical protein